MGPLTDVATLGTGHTPDRDRSDYWCGEIPWINLTEIRKLDGSVAVGTDLTITPEGVRRSSAVVHPAGTVAFSRTASVGFVTMMGRPMTTSQDFVTWTCGDLLDPRYLMTALIASREHLRSLSTGSTHRTIYMRVAERFRVLLPPLEEQRRIAAILDQADELRAKRRAAIAHLDSLTDAIFLDMFGDPALSQRFVALGDITASARLGLVRSSKQLSEGGPYPYIRMNAISADGRLDSSSLQRTFASRDELASSTLDRGDLLFNTRNSRDLVGKCAVFRGDERCLFNNNLLRLRFTDGIAPEFVWAVLNSTYGKRELMSRASGTTSVFAIYAKDLASVPIPLADPDRQALFSDAVAEVDSNRSQHTTSLSALDVLFASLQARAFAGDL